MCTGNQHPQYFQFPKLGYNNDGLWNLNYMLEEGQFHSSVAVRGFQNEVGILLTGKCVVMQVAR